MFVLSRLMMVLVQAGRLDQALHWADEAAAHDPGLGWSYNYGKGWVYLLMERFADAVDTLRQTEFNDAHLLLAVAYSRLGRMADAHAEVRKMTSINPTLTLQRWRLGYSFRDPGILDRYALDLVKAGFSER
jgi:adenylate cyclase